MAEITLNQHKIIASKAQELLLNLHDSVMYPYVAYGYMEFDISANTLERIYRAKRESERLQKEMELICSLFDLVLKIVTDEITVNAWKIKVPLYHIELLDSSGNKVLTSELPWREKQLFVKNN